MLLAQLAPLTTWQTFYILIGTASATLTGLMFIVVTLLAGVRARIPLSGEVFATFNTPNVVHFGLVLLVAAVLSAPWQALWLAGALLGLCGLGGATYAIIVLLRVRRQTDYRPVLEDWLFHTVLPLVSYSVLVIAGILLSGQPTQALFIIAAATLLLLFVGIHNAWDNVTFIALDLNQPENKRQEK
jgi:hypothetical protein